MKRLLSIFLIVFLLSGCGKKDVFKNEITEVNGALFVNTTTQNGVLSNTKCGWGLKKNKNAPPEIPASVTEMLKKYGAIYKSEEEKTLYLTFDEGYENGYTAKILDVLKENQVSAAFFVTGPYIKKEEELIKRMANEGHIVGNHTVNHPSIPDISEEELKIEIENLSENYFNLTGKKMNFFRPPMGEYSEKTLKIINDMGYRSVFWSFAYKDWEVKNQKGTGFAYNQIMDGVHNGAILLLHAVSKDNAEVLDRVIKDLKNQGYTFKSLQDFPINNNQ